MEERRKGTGCWEAVRDKPDVFAEVRWAECSEKESRGALLEEEVEDQRSTGEADRQTLPQLQVGTGWPGGRLGVTRDDRELLKTTMQQFRRETLTYDSAAIMLTVTL